MFARNVQVKLLSRRYKKYKKFTKNFQLLMYYIFKKRNRVNFVYFNYLKPHKFFNNISYIPSKKKSNSNFDNRIVSKFNSIFFTLFYFENIYKDYYSYYNTSYIPNCANVNLLNKIIIYKLLICW